MTDPLLSERAIALLDRIGWPEWDDLPADWHETIMQDSAGKIRKHYRPRSWSGSWLPDRRLSEHETSCLIFRHLTARLAEAKAAVVPVWSSYAVRRDGDNGVQWLSEDGSWSAFASDARFYDTHAEALLAGVEAVMKETKP